MMVVLRGRVVIRAPSSEGKGVILNIINEWEIFGEIALLDGKERIADATAMTDCELLVVAPFVFAATRTARHDARTAQCLVRAAAPDKRAGRGHAVSRCRARIGKILLRFAEADGAPQPGGALSSECRSANSAIVLGATRKSEQAAAGAAAHRDHYHRER
ncbi:MAG: cyclic nucleotide-binding domain-containing protein, partial [Alphaproteobacteria bacterium]|nr:cyclic nucleotide-binding domain-containing protein [Alphaproteobacteria bacterium]